jgi:hypothetical protein
VRLGEAAVLEEDSLELAEDDVEHVRVCREGDARDELGHVGIDHLGALAPRECGAVVTVDHEVRLAELHGDDRWEAHVGESTLQRAHPVAAEGVQRTEIACERACAAVRADERVERDRPDTQVPASERLHSPLDVVELEEALAAAGPQSLHLEVSVQQRSSPLARSQRRGGGLLLSILAERRIEPSSRRKADESIGHLPLVTLR